MQPRDLKVLNFIGGKSVPAKSGRWLDNFEPATGQVFSQIADSDHEDVAVAVRAAVDAFGSWSLLPSEVRGAWLRKVARGIEARFEEFVQAESRDQGKPLSVARSVDIPRSIRNLDFFADAATQFSSESFAAPGQAIHYTLRAPLGVVATISPWNLPLYLLTWKIAPALAAGCTVVAKPSEVTPLTAHLLAEVCAQVGLPPGVLNLLHGTGTRVGTPLIEHPDIKAVSFTGSTTTGRAIASACAPRFKKTSLEMGGKNPMLVFADAIRTERELADVVAAAVRSSFSNQGQICLCGSRILIEQEAYVRFRDAFVKAVSALRVAPPTDETIPSGLHQGAVVSKPHFEKVVAAIATARQEGGRVLTGGERVVLDPPHDQGWYIAPTVIEFESPAQRAGCSTLQDEIFGPVVTLQAFESEAEALGMANGTAYGLAASVWTSHLTRAHRLAERLEFGIVWVNSWMLRDLRIPFGGVKSSGMGREGGLEAMRFFTEPKSVCIRYGE